MRESVLCTMTILALSLFGTLGCNCFARPDDTLEPNDDLAHAIVLSAGQVVTARANQWNADVFVFSSEEGRTIVFSMQSLGGEDCAAFTVTGPEGEVLYQDSGSFCSSKGEYPAVKAEGVEFKAVEDSGYEIIVPTSTAGNYYLRIYEQGQADNIFPFSWDYRLMATIE
jgi:glycine cleavage system aminomethyltransferase T